jgi:hypothetical protein
MYRGNKAFGWMTGIVGRGGGIESVGTDAIEVAFGTEVEFLVGEDIAAPLAAGKAPRSITPAITTSNNRRRVRASEVTDAFAELTPPVGAIGSPWASHV